MPDRILDDEEIRGLTLWETDGEIPAFKAGWRARAQEGPQTPAPEGRDRVGDLGQNERVAWERGWLAADAVYKRLINETAPSRVVTR
jgi:hypothetical protein